MKAHKRIPCPDCQGYGYHDHITESCQGGEYYNFTEQYDCLTCAASGELPLEDRPMVTVRATA